MAKKVLDLSSTLSPLKGDLQETLKALGVYITQDELEQSIDFFATKYGKLHFQSLDELLQASFEEAKYQTSSKDSLEDLLKDLLPI